MKKIILFLLLITSGFVVSAQSINPESEAVKTVINHLFQGMKKGDSSLVNSTFSKGMILQSIAERKGNIEVRTEEAVGFLKAVGTPHTEIWDERITFDNILIDGNLASVWTSYQFYLGNKFSHCGVNSFQLVKGVKGWKIVYLIDTRRKVNCN